MGQAWKLGLWRVFRPLFDLVDQNKLVHSLAARYIYSKELYADFFVLASGLGLSSLAALGTVVYWQVTYDWLPWWLVYAYYFAWVGMGGRGMGGAYTLSHKEGHHRGGGLYRPWIANNVGNFWENWMGLIYGIVPYNFSTAHVFLHHKLNAGKGDTMYQWDLDRSSWSDLMLYQYRVLTYMTGWSRWEQEPRRVPRAPRCCAHVRLDTRRDSEGRVWPCTGRGPAQTRCEHVAKPAA